MSLTERPGLFLGTKYDRSHWFLVDPTTPAGAVASTNSWRKRWAPTNTPRSKRVFAKTLAWVIVAIGTFVGSAAGAILLEGMSSMYFGAICLGFAGFAGGGILGVKVHSLLVPRRGHDGPRVPGIVELALELVHWPGANDLPISDLWELNDVLTKTKQLHVVFGEWGPWYDDASSEQPVWAFANVVGPVLRPELAKYQLELERVAARVGFPIPESLSTLPQSFSDFATD